MSFPFLPTDTWIPSRANSQINPLVSVWLKSTIVNCLSVAPVIPLLRGWALYCAQRSNNIALTDPPYRGAIDAVLKSGNGLNVYRGSLPLIAAIPLTSAFALSTALSGLMFSSDIDTYASAATAIVSIIAGEICVQPFRYLYFQKATDLTSSITYGNIWRFSSWNHIYRGIGLTTTAALMIQMGPHLERYFGLDRSPNYRVPIYAGVGMMAYICYVTGFRRMIAADIKSAPTLKNTLRSLSPMVILSGIMMMTLTRTLVTTLQSNFSAKSHLIPF
jgi:hypothetical protein